MLFVLAGAGALGVAHAAEGASQSRPRIGLVLSGGGARGAAHVGVLRVLNELRIPVDYIAGTSMGAAVGGLYAAGLSPAELEALIVNIDWSQMFRDMPPRRDLSFRRKEDDADFLIDFELGVRGRRFILPRGLITGQNLGVLLRQQTLSVASINDFDQLPIPFRALATDIETGEAVVLGRGVLADAIQASMSVPTAYAPFEIDGRLLVDGGLASNVPINVIRAMGADVLIVVDAGMPKREREQLESLFDVSRQVLALMTRRNSEAELEQLTEQDVLITPDLDDMHTVDFTRVGEAVAAGEAAALRAADKLRALSVSQDAYARFLAQQQSRRTDRFPRVEFIRVESNSRIASGAIRKLIHAEPGDVLNPEQLRADTDALYGLGYFERVSLDVVDEEERVGLIINARAKSWGPNYLRFGLNLSDDFEGESHYNVLLNLTMTELNPLGAELRNVIQLGQTRRVLAEYYQPLDYGSRFFIAPRLEYREEVAGVFSGDNRIADYQTRSSGGGIDFGVQFGRAAELRLGLVRQIITAGPLVGDPTLPVLDINQGAASGRFTYDQLDNANFPRKGAALNLSWFAPRAGLGADTDYDKLELSWIRAQSLGRHTLLAGIDYGTALDTTLPVYDEFSLGGFLSLSGYKAGQLRGQHFGLFRLIYYRRVGRPPSTALGSYYYVGGSIEAGNVWADRSAVNAGDLLYAASLSVGADTIIGPAYLAYGFAEQARGSAYLFLGRSF